MKFRVSGCYWSKGQFRNRGITMFRSFLQRLWSSDNQRSACQLQCIVDFDTPVSSAICRKLQCVQVRRLHFGILADSPDESFNSTEEIELIE
jgi:hypothetical protein